MMATTSDPKRGPEITGDEARRTTALELAVKLTAEQQLGSFDAKITVNVARAFEGYLEGGE